MDESQFANKYLDKLMRVETNEGRVIIGKTKCIDDRGNIYLTQVVEVFNKDSDNYCFFDIYENHQEHAFYFDSDKCNYQLYNNCIIPMKEIAKINILKEEQENTNISSNN